MTSLNVKMNLIKLDMVVKDIHHLWSEVPSGYVYPKSILAQSRAYVRSDVKKALFYADKARKAFQSESILATRYNAISDEIDGAGENARVQRNQYLRFTAEGEYGLAGNCMERMTELVRKSERIGTHISVELRSSDTDGCIVTFTNSGEYTVMVSRLTVTKGSEKVRTIPGTTFSIQPKSAREVSVQAVPNIVVTAEYTEHGENHTVSREL